jgi:hypothetical protein
MIVRPDERVPIARLLAFLAHGERLAHDCAHGQAALAENSNSRRFFLSQARQEALHAGLFHSAVLWLAPRRLGACPLLPPLERYREKLMAAVDRRDLLEAVLGEQVILEGVGEALLNRIDAGLLKRDAPFGGLRRMLLKQEEAHAGFGRRILERAMGCGATDAETLRGRAQGYLGLAGDMITTLCELFDEIDEDASAWASDVTTYLPPWLNEHGEFLPLTRPVPP